MATISHKNLSGSQLHELKGVSAATDNQVPYASSGATTWGKLTHSNLQTTGNPFGAQLLHVRHTETAGTAGGTTTAGSYQQRKLNTSVTNEITSASLTSNQISLPAGTYMLYGWGVYFGTNNVATRLRNVTDGATLVAGMRLDISSAFSATLVAPCIGRFTLSGTKTIEYQYHCATGTATNGLGYASGSTGETEVYADITIYKVA